MPPFMYEKMDVSNYLRWLHDPVVMQYSEQRHRKHTEASQYEYLCSFQSGDNYFWDIHFDGTHIGTASAFRDADNKTANMGILIGVKQYWSRGLGCEAWEAISHYLFDSGTRKIEAGCMANNKAMIRILDKLQFTHEAIIHGHFLVRGQPQDMHLYGKFRTAKVISINQKTGQATQTETTSNGS